MILQKNREKRLVYFLGNVRGVIEITFESTLFLIYLSYFLSQKFHARQVCEDSTHILRVKKCERDYICERMQCNIFQK